MGKRLIRSLICFALAVSLILREAAVGFATIGNEKSNNETVAPNDGASAVEENYGDTFDDWTISSVVYKSHVSLQEMHMNTQEVKSNRSSHL